MGTTITRWYVLFPVNRIGIALPSQLIRDNSVENKSFPVDKWDSGTTGF